MIRLDHELERFVVAHRVGALDPVFRALSYAGTFGAVWLAIALVLACSRRSFVLAAAVVLADCIASLSASGLQELFRRARPSVPTLVPRPASYSFPSGHAATSFACATVIAALSPSLRLPAFVLATAIAWSRVYVGVHYPLDVVAGALYGAGVGLVVLRGLPRLAAVRPRSRRAPRAG